MYELEAQWGLNIPWTTGARHDAITECVRCSTGPRRALERRNDTRDFIVGRLLRNLPELRSIGFAANRRMLEIEQISHDCALGEDAFQDLQRPRHVDGQRAPALRFADPNVQALLHALVMFFFVARGFTNQDLRQAYAVLLGLRAGEIGPGRMSYELRRLRLHGLIERVTKTHRYRLTNLGLQTA